MLNHMFLENLLQLFQKVHQGIWGKFDSCCASVCKIRFEMKFAMICCLLLSLCVISAQSARYIVGQKQRRSETVEKRFGGPLLNWLSEAIHAIEHVTGGGDEWENYERI